MNFASPFSRLEFVINENAHNHAKFPDLAPLINTLPNKYSLGEERPLLEISNDLKF